MKDTPVITRTMARRLAIRAQMLAGPRPVPTEEGIMEVVERLGCLQLDPLSVVARSHLLVLWSRVGSYDPAILDTLLWQKRVLFEYWAHAASIVLTEDYLIHELKMRRYGQEKSSNAWTQRIADWAKENSVLQESVLKALKERGPLRLRDIEDESHVSWHSSGWTNERNVSRMLDILWTQGKIMVTKRTKGEKWWDLTERCFPQWTTLESLTEREIVHLATQKSLRALGIGTARDIVQHFTRDRYPGLSEVLHDLKDDESIIPVRVYDGDRELPGSWFVHADFWPVVEEIMADKWEPRTTLLSPFDNLICDRKRAITLFDFLYSSEFYTPKHKRKYGYYVMPILYGDRLIGRVDPSLDRKRRELVIQALHWEDGIEKTSEVQRAVTEAIEDLAAFLGAENIRYAYEENQALIV